MSERLEQWKAREKIRSDIGWAAVFIGLWGLTWVAQGLSQFNGPNFPLLLPVGIALVICAVGLWKVQAWARWTAAILFSAVSLGLFLSGQICLLPFAFFAAVYLVLPSMGRKFARAQGIRTKVATSTAPDP